jgi:hypothetical protein
MGMEGLGRVLNVVPIAAGTLLSVKDCAGISFCCTGNDTFTLKSAATYNGSPSTLATITNYWTNTSTAGAAEWVAATQSAADAVTIASGAAMFYVDAADLPSAAEYLEVTVAASGLVAAILHDLLVQRSPDNLRTLSGSAS